MAPSFNTKMQMKKVLRYAGIVGTGSYLPEKILTNHDIVNMGVDTSDEWIYSHIGIKERHISSENQATSDLATEAAKKAIESSGVNPSEIDLIIVGTSTPDMPTPSTACIVQDKL